jgi:hypothetical protein
VAVQFRETFLAGWETFLEDGVDVKHFWFGVWVIYVEWKQERGLLLALKEGRRTILKF